MPFTDLHLPAGFLTDRGIRKSLAEGYLVTRGTWSDNSIRHASYTLRIGARVEVADFSRANTEERRNFVRHDLHAGQHIDLRPGDTAKLYAIEILDLPSEILAFSVARGLFFFEALLPENTYADPGFGGEFYITVTNLSHRVVRLEYEAPIARLFFYNLAEPVEEPFRQGAARGIPQRLESFRATQLGSPPQCRAASETALMEDLTRSSLTGPQEAELLRRLAHRNRSLIVLTVMWPTLLVFANLNSIVRETLGWVWSNLVAIVASTALTVAFTWVWDKVKKL